MSFEWDPANAASNWEKHGVKFSDALAIFDDPRALTIPDPQPVEARFVTVGMDVFRASGGAAGATLVLHGSRAMRAGYDFSKGVRGPVVPPPPGKTRITIRLDTDILDWYRDTVETAGGGNYQTMINDALRREMERKREPLEKIVRRVVREELARSKRPRGS